MAKALLLGLLADMVPTILFGTVFLFVFASANGLDPLSEEIEAELASSAPYLAVALAIGLLFAVLGGYVAGRVANRPRLRVGVYFAVLLTVVSLLFLPAMGGYPLWYSIASYLFTPAAALAGAILSPAPTASA